MFSGKKTGHYQAEQWVDFVRGLTSGEDRSAMQAHLESGCARCGELASFFSKVALRASADMGYEVPEHAVRYARAVYSLRKPEEVRLLPRTIAKLVYDSFQEPLLAGVRSRQQLTHQLMYVAGPYCVDLRLERERETDKVTLVGQIANREKDAQGVSNVPVLLFSRDSVVGRSVSNEFGEFAMEYRPTSSLRLYAPVPGEDEGIEVRLGRASTGKTDTKNVI